MRDDLDAIARDVLRDDVARPGFALIDAAGETPSGLRSRLVEIGRGVIARYGRGMTFRSVSWFSQTASTRPHRDGGPDASVLLLGYEATAVPSRLFLLDFSRAAREAGITPRDFLDRYNPMVGEGAAILRPYTIEVTGFDPSRARILAVNNGCLDGEGMLGVLHHAHVGAATAGAGRPISSVLLGVEAGGLDDAALAAFVRDGTAASA